MTKKSSLTLVLSLLSTQIFVQSSIAQLNSAAMTTGGTVRLTIDPSDDAFVRSSSPSTNYNNATYLRVRGAASSHYTSYLKFRVRNVGGLVKKATLRLFVIEPGSDGGSIYSVSNNFRGTGNAWDEENLTFSNAPTVAGTALRSVGPVSDRQTVEIDITSAIVGNGTYSFALLSETNEIVRYRSKEGSNGPELVLLVDQTSIPKITSFNPRTGVVGSSVTITGENLGEVRAVSFGSLQAASFIEESSTRLTAVVPAGAVTSEISVTTALGTATSGEKLAIVAVPTITAFIPTEGPPGSEVTIAGTNLSGLSAVLFTDSEPASFSVDSDSQARAYVPLGATTGAITVRNAAGSAVSSQVFDVAARQSHFTMPPASDAFVRSKKPVTNYGAHDELRVRQPHSDRVISYLKFKLSATGGDIQSAKLRLRVLDGSQDGGAISLASNNYKGSSDPWHESGLIFNNAPAIDSEPVYSIGPVSPGQVVEIDLTHVITGDGEYSFAIQNEVNDLAVYSSKEGPDGPQLIIDLPAPTTTPAISRFSPTNGQIGTEVTLTGSNFTGVQEVLFNVTPALSFTVDSSERLRAVVPTGASTGAISITSGQGTGTSHQSFVIISAPEIFAFEPTAGPPGSEVTILGSSLSGTTQVSFEGTLASAFDVVSSTELHARVPQGARTGPITVSNDAGTATSENVFTVTELPSSLALQPTDDGYIRTSRPTRKYGHADQLKVRRSSGAEYTTYLKFNVTGLGGQIAQAILRLHVLNASEHGGDIFAASNNFLGSQTPWTESDLNTENAPEVTGGILASVAAAHVGEVVEIDLTETITSDGIYSFALRSSSSDLASYSSKEGVRPPELLIEAKGGSSSLPVIHGFSPANGLVGTLVTVTGDNFVKINEVSFNETSTISYIVDTPTRIRATVPIGATSGKIRVRSDTGSGSSERAFIVGAPPALPRPPSISSFTPTEGLFGTEVTISGTNLSSVSGVAFNGSPATSFEVDSDAELRATVPAAATSGTISVTNGLKSATSAQSFTVTSEPTASIVTLLEDAFVDSRRRTRNFGDSNELRVRRSSVDFDSYLKFRVIGLTEPVKRAILRLQVVDGSVNGGEVYSVSNDLRDSRAPWSEENLTYDNAPGLAGRPLANLGRVTGGEFVEIDVTAAVSGNGTYSFALSNDSRDLANYSAKEGEVAPELLINTGGDPEPTRGPIISSFTPTSGVVGTEVTILGKNFIKSSNGGSSLKGKIKIMPLGNSITQGVHGSTDDAGYRNDLAELLKSEGIDFDFVGSRRNGRGFDRNHEGHSGFRADELLSELDGYLRRNPPEMILLHIGTNDISELQSPETTIDEIEEILDRIHRFDADITVILSSVIPRNGSKNGKTTTLNRYINDRIPVKQAEGYNLFYAGNNEAFKANPKWESEYLDDKVHPNDAGYAVMAGVWFDRIVDILGGSNGSSGVTVAFNGQPARNVSVDSPEQLRAVVPLGATTGKISVDARFGAIQSAVDFQVTGTVALQLSNPVGGEAWELGSTHTIAWHSGDAIDLVNLDYSLDDGQTWRPVAEGVPNTGRFIWQVPQSISEMGLIRVSDAQNSRRGATSKSQFALVSPPSDRLPSLTELRRAAIGRLSADSEILIHGDVNLDGGVDLLDVLNALDVDLNGAGKSRLTKIGRDQFEPDAVVRLAVAGPRARGEHLVNVPIEVASTVPVRGFQISLRFDPSEVESLAPALDEALDNMIIDTFSTVNKLNVVGYLKKEHDAIQLDAVLLNLGVKMRPEFKGEPTIEVTEALFVSKSRRAIRLDGVREAGKLVAVPSDFKLLQNYPNPFNNSTQIGFSLPIKSEVEVRIYNLRGELVRTLLNEEREPGHQKILWDGANDGGETVASGIYVYRIKAGAWQDSRKLTLVK